MTFFYFCVCILLTLLFLAALPLLVPIAIVAGIVTLILDRKDPPCAT